MAERFFRGQRSAEVAGSGIGLTIVSELIKAHHGDLEIASTQGVGTSVTVTLPLADSSQPTDFAPRRPATPGARRRHERMLNRDQLLLFKQ